MMQILSLPLLVYAACGLVLSLIVHVLSIFGVALGGQTLFYALHAGIFPMWIAVMVISFKISNGERRKDFWKIAMSGCPAWMKYMTYGFFVYAVVNFLIFFLLMAGHPIATTGDYPSAQMLHGFSGHWMAFYSAGLAIFTTAYRRGLSNLQRKCPYGHTVSLSDQFCPTCGSSITPAQHRN